MPSSCPSDNSSLSGKPGRFAPRSTLLQTATHSLQMKADGPWIKDLTDFESLPQKLQNRTFRGFEVLRFGVPRAFLL
jgi:hypothetical protein